MADYKSTHTGEQIDTAIDNANSNWSLLMANLGVGRWANHTLERFDYLSDTNFSDGMAKYFTNYARYLAYSTWNYTPSSVTFSNDLGSGEGTYFLSGADWGDATVYLPNGTLVSPQYLILGAKIGKLLIKDGCTFKLTGFCDNLFRQCSNITEIGAFDLSGATNLNSFIYASSNVKSIHCTHYKVSFDISPSTKFEEADLVEIISNLDTVTTTQILIMGATNLAKLTDEEKKVATDKGWVLA